MPSPHLRIMRASCCPRQKNGRSRRMPKIFSAYKSSTISFIKGQLVKAEKQLQQSICQVARDKTSEASKGVANKLAHEVQVNQQIVQDLSIQAANLANRLPQDHHFYQALPSHNAETGKEKSNEDDTLHSTSEKNELGKDIDDDKANCSVQRKNSITKSLKPIKRKL
jgi:hypothetical protein